MSETLKPKQAPERNIPKQGPGVATPPQGPRIIPVEDIINNYPVDREKIRDVLLLEISKKLERIASSMEKFVLDAEERMKDEKV